MRSKIRDRAGRFDGNIANQNRLLTQIAEPYNLCPFLEIIGPDPTKGIIVTYHFSRPIGTGLRGPFVNPEEGGLQVLNQYEAGRSEREK